MQYKSNLVLTLLFILFTIPSQSQYIPDLPIETKDIYSKTKIEMSSLRQKIIFHKTAPVAIFNKAS